MSLSDACFLFSIKMDASRSDAQRRTAVLRLRREIAWYSKPPFRYGDELRTLDDACVEFLDGPTAGNADPLQRVRFLAEAIREHLDMPPNAKVPMS